MTDKQSIRVALFLTVLALGSANVTANPDRLYLASQDQVPWHSLSNEEQDELHNYRGRWHNYDADRQQRMREGARKFRSLPADRRHEVEQTHHEYERLSPREKRRLRNEYQHRNHN